jgi:hypothetical protein
MPGIFISYRRSDDSLKYARDLAEKLRDAFGPDMVFRDITGIAPGEKFAVVLRERLRWCSVMLVVIGRRWLSEPGRAGQANRLYDPDDWVQLEISAGLRRKGISVIPVLVAGAMLPSDDQLPTHLKPLLGNQAVRLDPDTHWEDDRGLLIESLAKQGLKRLSSTTWPRGRRDAEADTKRSVGGDSVNRSKRTTKRSLSQEDCVGRWRLEVDGDLVEIRLEADGSWTATEPGKGVVSNLVKRYQGEWSVKNGFLRITQTRFGIPFMSGPLRKGSSPWVAGKISRITEHRIALRDGTTLTAV